MKTRTVGRAIGGIASVLVFALGLAQSDAGKPVDPAAASLPPLPPDASPSPARPRTDSLLRPRALQAPSTNAVPTPRTFQYTPLASGLASSGGGSGTLISFFYLVFLTDVVRISPGLAGIVILVSKIYDAITDPFEGVISDRTRTKLGRRRPYLLAGIPLVFL